MIAPKYLTTRLSAALAATLCLAAATPAFAGEFVSNGRTAEVRYGDLNLAQAEGKAELSKRISGAASRVCQSGNRGTFIACRRATLKQVNASVTTAIARAETKSRYADASDAAPDTVIVTN